LAIQVVYQDKGHPYDKPTPIRTFYEGLSTDTKPLDCNVGSSFYELDANVRFNFNGTSWLRNYNEYIDVYHNKVHGGQIFTISKTFKSIAENEYARLHITSGSKEVHFTFSFTTEGKSYLNTYAGTTYTNVGTSQPIFNRKPASGSTPISQAWITPTVNVLGTLRGDDFVGAGGNVQTQAGGTGAEGLESIIPPNTDFMFQFQNVGSGAKDVGIIVNFYEE